MSRDRQLLLFPPHEVVSAAGVERQSVVLPGESHVLMLVFGSQDLHEQKTKSRGKGLLPGVLDDLQKHPSMGERPFSVLWFERIEDLAANLGDGDSQLLILIDEKRLPVDLSQLGRLAKVLKSRVASHAVFVRVLLDDRSPACAEDLWSSFSIPGIEEVNPQLRMQLVHFPAVIVHSKYLQKKDPRLQGRGRPLHWKPLDPFRLLRLELSRFLKEYVTIH